MYLSDAPETPATDWLSTLVNTATQAYRDKKIAQAQADRIRAGQQPVALPQVYDQTVMQLPGTVPRSLAAPLSTNTLLMVGVLAAVGVGVAVLAQGRRRR